MKQEITYQQLDQLSTDIQKQVSQSPAFYYFNKEKIKRFYQLNQLRLQAIEEKKKSLVKKYVQHENREPLTKDNEQGTKVYVFADRFNEDAYIAEYTTFMNQSLPLLL